MNWRIYVMGSLGLVAGATAAWIYQPAWKLPTSAMTLPSARPTGSQRGPSGSSSSLGSVDGSLDAALAFVTKGQQSVYECGYVGTENRTTGLTSGGKVTDYGLKAFGISPLKKQALQQVVDMSLARTSEMLAARMKPDPLASDPDKGIVAYEIPPDREAGKEMMEQTRQDLIAVLGVEKTDSLGSLLYLDNIAFFGLQGTSLRIITDPVTGEKTIHCSYYEPMTREQTGTKRFQTDPAQQGPMDRFITKVLPR
jgi:hypothetical protein